jgi:hypothetical protein
MRAAAAQTEDYSSANSFMVCGVDNAFTLDDFKERFSIDVTSLGARVSPLSLRFSRPPARQLPTWLALRSRAQRAHRAAHTHAPTRARASAHALTRLAH